MPHAALWVVQQILVANEERSKKVSMPHAALWVVQLGNKTVEKMSEVGFNAARGFVGGAALVQRHSH